MLDDFKGRYTITTLYIISHGSQDGRVFLAAGVYVPLADLQLVQPGKTTNTTVGVHCYAHNDPYVEPSITQRMLGNNIMVSTSDQSKIDQFTWDVPREAVDGSEGWVHTALNPEIKKISLVQQLIVEAYLRWVL